jgi:hypothetical protein
VNGYEQLLHWTAEVGAGRFGMFSGAHAWATGEEVPAMQTLRLMTALGYVEVDWAGRRWAAVRPTITLLPDAGGYGLVVGARTERLTRELSDNVDDPDVFVDARAQWQAPDTCFVAADSEAALERLATQFGLPFVHSVTERLADVLPSLDVLLHGTAPAVVQHYGVERYDLEFGFQAVDDDRSPGFYRYEISGPRRMQFQAADGRRYHVDLAVGAWAEARRLGELAHIWWRPDGTNGSLMTPWRLPLPSLHARSAALCSGLAPYVTDDGVNYVNVPEWVAIRIARSLGQELVHI